MPPLMIASHRSGIPAARAFNLSSQVDPCSHAAALVLSATRLSAPGARVIVGALCKKRRGTRFLSCDRYNVRVGEALLFQDCSIWSLSSLVSICILTGPKSNPLTRAAKYRELNVSPRSDASLNSNFFHPLGHITIIYPEPSISHPHEYIATVLQRTSKAVKRSAARCSPSPGCRSNTPPLSQSRRRPLYIVVAQPLLARHFRLSEVGGHERVLFLAKKKDIQIPRVIKETYSEGDDGVGNQQEEATSAHESAVASSRRVTALIPALFVPSQYYTASQPMFGSSHPTCTQVVHFDLAWVVNVFLPVRPACLAGPCDANGGVCRAGDTNEALKLREFMESKELYPAVVTFNAILRRLCEEGRIQDANKLPKEKSSPICDLHTLINAYCKIVDMKSALKVKGKMIEGGLRPEGDEMYRRRLMVTLKIFRNINASYATDRDYLDMFWSALLDRGLISKSIYKQMQQ
ncbi:pentatricopeptide repeat-containing protein [Striga asiatica]|uniref:Pentatricopeptide repeat-containing protein n=1 Tax=Striga asiatica TaxID=4170 RepID=A0A5A7PTY3_STRAF|nr:pentatricopeptide repeat-containing protein [Striga asiatica]